MRFLLPLIVVLGGIQAWNNMDTAAIFASSEPIASDALPAQALPEYSARRPLTPESHPCHRMKRCLVTYIAPWCPSCKASLALINRLQHELGEHPAVGMAVVMGSAGSRWSNPSAMAARLSRPLLADPDGQFWRAFRGEVNGVPGWVVYDAEGRALASFSGGFRSASEPAKRALLSRVNLDGYLTH